MQSRRGVGCLDWLIDSADLRVECHIGTGLARDAVESAIAGRLPAGKNPLYECPVAPARATCRPGSSKLWLLALLLLLWPLGSASAETTKPTEHRFVGAAKCKTCHKKELIGEQYAVWLRGPHHRAYETLKRPESDRISAELGFSGPAVEQAFCMRCHTTAHKIPAERIAYPVPAEAGVQCESCHGPGRDYRKKKIMSDPDEARRRGLWEAETDASICTACHNSESPTFDPARYTLKDGGSVGFDFDQARERIAHPIPADVKGHYLEIDKRMKAEAKKNAR
jgi:hypothetical protein